MRRRVLLLPALMLMHLAVAVAVLRSSAVAALMPRAETMAVVEVPAPASPYETPSPPTAETAIALDVDAPQFEIAAAPIAPTAGCALTDAIQVALGASNAAQRSLDRLPAGARSVANALMIWDGHWNADPALQPIQQLVAASIRAAPEDCRMMPITGPRLLFIPDGAGSAVLAFGSGVWNWSQLLT